MTRKSFGLCLLLPVLAVAEPDTSDWECSSCPFPNGWHVNLDAGLGLVDDFAYRFGDYRGFDDDDFVLLGDFEVNYWSPNGFHWTGAGSDLAQDARSLWFSGGLAGTYDLRLSYDELPRRLYDTAQTPFRIDGGSLSLPGDWVPAGSTQGMTALAASSTPVEIAIDRKSLGLGISFTPSSRIVYSADYRRETRDGTGIHAGSFISQSALLPEPIDYTTEQFDASVSYVANNGQVSLAYYGSVFDNKLRALSWDNPFAPAAPGADRGSSALPPDNEAHQLILSGSLRLTKTSHLSARVAIGRLRQNEGFLPATINDQITGVTLPLASLSGAVDTTNADVRLRLRPTRKLRLSLNATVDNRDNDTPRETYPVVQSDLYLSGSRINAPYSFRRSGARLDGSYRVNRRISVGGGVRYRNVDRDFQEVHNTEEVSGWFDLRYTGSGRITGATLKIGQDDREGSAYRLPGETGTAETGTGQNPLLRKFNLADRDHEFIAATVSLLPVERIDLTLGYERSDDTYDKTVLGLTAADSERAHIDSAIRLSDKAMITLFYENDRVIASQTGSSSFGSVDWSSRSVDEIDTLSAGLRFPQVRDKLDLGVEYTLSDGSGTNRITPSGGQGSDFPELTTRLEVARLYADYRPKERTSISVSYYFEKLKTRDWMIDGIAPDTLPSLLALGIDSPDYSVGVLALTWRYAFVPE